jgi:ribosomal protein S18 acetylase RimI-like enzyme
MITLVARTTGELAAWLPDMVAHYIEERVSAGELPETARASGTAQFEQLFPGGEPAEGQHVMAAVQDGEVVGTLWMGRPFSNDEHTWYVFYVEVDEAFRGRGLGRATMEAAERWTIEHGGTRIALNVFGPNAVARSLYDSLGFQVMATSMYKELGAAT